MHDVSRRSRLLHIEDAHKGKVSGVCFGQQDRLLSCGVDRNIKLWDSHKGFEETGEEDDSGAGPSKVSLPRPSYGNGIDSNSQRKPLSIFPGKAAFK